MRRSSPSARGDVVIRPLLQFFYDNEVLDNQVSTL